MGWFKKEISDVAAMPPSGALMPPEDGERPAHATGADGVETRAVRNEVYSVRVRKGFKRELRIIRSELQDERKQLNLAAAMTDGELLELMLGLFRSSRDGAPSMSRAVPLSEDVWQGVDALARKLQSSPSRVIEELVVQKASELKLFFRRGR